MPQIRNKLNITNCFKLIKLPISSLISYYKAQILFGKFNNKIITIYGSARIADDAIFYKKTKDLAYELAKNGHAIMTGGGPGLMQAANEGAKLANRPSLGCSIKTKNECKNNQHLDFVMKCEYFFIRKVILTKFSKAFIIAPGGYGTLDELFEMLNLIVTDRLNKKPIILYGVEYWQPLLTFINQSLRKNKMISEDDENLITVTDNINEICKIIN